MYLHGGFAAFKVATPARGGGGRGGGVDCSLPFDFNYVYLHGGFAAFQSCHTCKGGEEGVTAACCLT